MGLFVMHVIDTVAVTNQFYTGKQLKNQRKGFEQQATF